MSVTTDIVRSYRHPRRVIREKLDQGPREDRALAYLMLACGLIFVAQWPRLSREAHLSEIELQPLLGAALMGWVFIAPLLFYLVAALQRGVARLVGGKGTGYGSRLALFWTLLAVSPIYLLFGLVQGLVARGTAEALVGFFLVGAFCLIWVSGVLESEGSADE